MASRDGSTADLIGDRQRNFTAMVSMMGLYFLVLLSVGILRPIRNTLALDGLGQTDFYKVYLVSALVVVFVPILNRLSDHVSWRRLIPGVALFLALNLLVFRLLYVEGSTAFGLAFYGWYDLFAAALVTQLFMVTQLFFHARMAKHAYPLVIAGGSLGASAGGAVTGFLAESVGTPNLMLAAAGLIALFSVAVTWIWSIEGMVPDRGPEPRRAGSAGSTPSGGASGGLGLRAIFSNRQVLLIAGLVLTTIVVKQFVDYQFNTITKEVFQERDAIAAFQGKFGAATQWLPIVVLLLIRRPMRRWGIGFVVLVLPVSMLLTNVGLILFWGLWAAVAAKGAETSFRYSAERAGREILYVPVPDEFKLKAKAYIDVAVEKGVGKVLSALILFLLLTRIEYAQVAWVGAGLSACWIVMALAVRREYVRSLARSIENRFASLRGVHASLGDEGTIKVIREALRGHDRQVAFALDLMDQAEAGDSAPLADDLHGLFSHQNAEIRRRSLALLARVPDVVDVEAVRRALEDPDPAVRRAAVRALHAAHPDDGTRVLEELLDSDDIRVRSATLSCLAEKEIDDPDVRMPIRLQTRGTNGDPANESVDSRVERALVAAALRPPSAVPTIQSLLDDEDLRVVRTALRSAGRLGEPILYPQLIRALARPATREAARDALALQGVAAVPALSRHLLDGTEDRAVRRHIPSVLARIPASESVEALMRGVMATETDQLLDFRAIKALSKLRARNPELDFDPDSVYALVDRSLAAATLLIDARALLPENRNGSRAVGLFRQAVDEALRERREEVFRCLGLIHSPEAMHRCYLSLVRGETVPRANALEWLENTVRFQVFQTLEPVLGERPPERSRRSATEVLRLLANDEDAWIAEGATRVATELGFRLDAPGARTNDLLARTQSTSTGAVTMDLIETVFLLQQVDVLRDARSAHLALLGSIAEEVDADRGTVLTRKGEPAEALYVVVRGEVELTGSGGVIRLSDGQAFGTWALIDEVPSLVEAVAVAPTRLLRIGREDFFDLMTDHPELAIGMLQGLARRVRALVS